MGFGVHEEDTIGSQLERLLNENNRYFGNTFEVISCGMGGYTTREKRIFYQEFASEYEPHLVVLPMLWNDIVSWNEGKQGQLATRESLFRLWKRIRTLLSTHVVHDFSGTLVEIQKLNQILKRKNSRLALMFFPDILPNANLTERGKIWRNLSSAVTQEDVVEKDIRVLDLQKALYEQHSKEELVIDNPLDLHPNELAHEIAAKELAAFLKKEALLPMK